MPDVHVGQTAQLSLPYRPGEIFEGKVIYRYPYVDPKSRQIRVRLEFPNPELKLKPAMYADVELQAPIEGKQILVPQDAVIDIGRRRNIGGEQRHVGYTYVKVGEGTFEPREVELGEELEGGRLQIRSGLKPGEEVVVSGQFQLDSERRVKEANLAMLMQSRGKEEE
ncbi:Cation efflux system protein CusB precursor [Bremerella volcania]|uniref:Cation efflux system protein CusB n=1 Tax=Bremerella volcania TaxID=2527984 RepID=A0A518C5P6_9BACT|nr:Cation efflux system protein CusB precursor [Bremerella volcania]